MDKSQLVSSLERLSSDLLALYPSVNSRVLRVEELRVKLANVESTIESLLDPNSIQHRIFDRMRRENVTRWWHDDGPKYVEAHHQIRLAEWQSVISTILESIEPAFLQAGVAEKNQLLLPAGDVFTAKRVLFDLLKRAHSSVAIVDSYLDDEVFPFIASLGTDISVFLVTADRKPIFPVLLRALQKQRTNLEARQVTTFHDRFILIDVTEVWHLGASLNGLGSKLCMINRITDRAELDRFLQLFASEWSAGVVI